MCGIVEFIKHELSAYFDQTYFIPFLREWRERGDGKRYTVHLNGYQLTPVFVIPNFKISLGKGQNESGGQIQMKWRNWRFGSLGDGERGEEGRKKSYLWASASLLASWILFLFFTVGKSASFSPAFLSPHLLLFLPRKGGGGLWFIPLSFLPDFHKEETQRCLQDSVRTFPWFLNNDL